MDRVACHRGTLLMMLHGVTSVNELAKPVWRTLRQPDLVCTFSGTSAKKVSGPDETRTRDLRHAKAGPAVHSRSG
jgi:hypothetical protein